MGQATAAYAAGEGEFSGTSLFLGFPSEGAEPDCVCYHFSGMPIAAEFASVEELLRARDIDCTRERFRLPSRPQISPSAGLLACAAGAFFLSAGNAAASFLLGVAGAVVLLLDAYGFSPLAWLGPKETRHVLVVPGTPSEEKRKAFFFGIPLRCRLTETGYFSRKEALFRFAYAGGLALALLLCAVSAGVLLVILPPVPVFGVLAGTSMIALSAGEWVRTAAASGPRNVAAGWAGRLALSPDATFRPYLLVYSGDPSEVKYFLARYRGPLFRGRGIFLEFAPETEGPPAASVREGPLIPYRVDPALLSLVREAGRTRGIPPAKDATIRDRSPGLFAMARGFRATTVLGLGSSRSPEPPFPAETAAGWAEEIAAAAG